MFRFIGGPARCGKTTLTRQASEQYRGQLLSLDNLCLSYQAIASEEQYAKLKPSADIEDHPVDTWLNLLRARDGAIWLGAKAYLAAAAKLEDDVLLEGCLWPDYISELDTAYRAVFLVDTSDQHVDRVLAAAHSDSTHNNWMSSRSDTWLRKWSEYNVERSKLYVQLAQEYHQPVFDVGELGFQQAQTAALDYLFSEV